jgi:cell division protein FtsB
MPQTAAPAVRSAATEAPLKMRGRARQTVISTPSSRRGRFVNYALTFITIVLVVDALVGDKGLLETVLARKEYAEVAASLNALRQENQRLRNRIQGLTDDPATIESVAREDLGLIRPGELVFVVKDVDRKP